MGGQLTYLKKPIVKKDLCDGCVPGRARFGVCSMQGWRRGMEDAHLALPDLTGDGRMSLFGVFDGHGGCAVARFATKHLPDLLIGTEQFREADYQGALIASFLALDDKMLTAAGRDELRQLESSEPGGAGRVPLMVSRKIWKEITKTPRAQLKSMRLDETTDSSDDQVLVDPGAMKEVSPESQGCTAVVALIVWDGGNEAGASGAHLFVANAGDSRCILSRRINGDHVEACAMSEDHKPELPGETSRIEAGGGIVQNMPGGARVQGDLNLSRALGDFRHKQSKELPPEKQIVTACPEVRDCRLDLDAQMLILGCDGIWETNSNQQLAEKLRAQTLKSPKAMKSSVPLSALAAEVCDASLCPSMTPVENPSFDGTGCDNMTLLIVEFDRKEEETEHCLETAIDEFPISSAVADILAMVEPLDNKSEIETNTGHVDQLEIGVASACEESLSASSELEKVNEENALSQTAKGSDQSEIDKDEPKGFESPASGNEVLQADRSRDRAITDSTAVENIEVGTAVATTGDEVGSASESDVARDACEQATTVACELNSLASLSAESAVEDGEEPSEKRRKLGA
mmetsp:Transcript_67462/g.106780  ORF Transcript_67462/g.106780 Transcript_67462/m.106780 type:complete len:575 (+) Transcript_67462:54-1778(+)